MDIRNLCRVPAFITKDGSEIRELLGPANSSSAIRRWPKPGCRPVAAPRRTATSGPRKSTIFSPAEPRCAVGQETAVVGPGDAIAILPGASHQIANIGEEVLRFLCCCTGLPA